MPPRWSWARAAGARPARRGGGRPGLAPAGRGGAGARVNPPTQADPRIRDGLRESLWAFGGARLLLFVISVAGGGTLVLPPGQPPTDAGFPSPNLLPGWHMLFT